MRLKTRIKKLEAENCMLRSKLSDLEYKLEYIEECGMKNYLSKHLKDHIDVYATSVAVKWDANMLVENFRLSMKKHSDDILDAAKEEALKKII